MLSAEINDLITRTGPGTGAGRLMRNYWQPAALVDCRDKCHGLNELGSDCQHIDLVETFKGYERCLEYLTKDPHADGRTGQTGDRTTPNSSPGLGTT